MAARPSHRPYRPQARRAARAEPPVANQIVRLAHWRVYVIFAVALLITARLGARLFEVQVLDPRDYAGKAEREIQQEIVVNPNRGMILDRMGNVLALDIERESLWVIPSLLPQERVPAIAATLAPLIGSEPESLRQAMSSTDYYWWRVARWLKPEVATQIEALHEPGLRLMPEPLRYYPQKSFAAHVIGAVNRNGDGLSGVEAFYDTALKGITGTVKAEFDPAKNPIAIAPQTSRFPRDGANLRLTIDPVIQQIIETELKNSVERNRATGGSIVVIEVATGAVRGMASYPSFDPNHYDEFAPELYSRNPVVSNLYEPGSTFKMVTAAAGLESRAFTADTLVNDTGTIYYIDTTLGNWNRLGNGLINVDGMLYHSSNVGAVLFNDLTGPDNFYRIVRRFGFGAHTGIDLGGEEAGIVHPIGSPFYNDILLATNAYGQGISVTPLQMTLAAAAIANDGVLMRPYVVEERCDGAQCTTTTPTVLGQVIEPGVAWTIRRMLVNSANHYAPVVWAAQTGSYADQWLVPGYEVAAKTGTSSIPLPGGVGYDTTATIGSVLGFAPAEEARYAILVKVDRPADIWGVQTAIPLFQTVVDQIMTYERILPQPWLVGPSR